MINWKALLALGFLVVFGLGLAISCGQGDDDDDDDDVIDWSCSEGCQIIYEDCQQAVPDDIGNLLTQSECVNECNDKGGVSNCEQVCLDNYLELESCGELEDCMYDCYY